MKELHQRYIFSKKHFTLTDEKVLVKEKSAFQDQEFEARYNQIGLDLIKYRNREGIGNVVFFGGLMLLSIWFTYAAFTDGKSNIGVELFLILTCFMWGSILWWNAQKFFSSLYILQGGNKTLDFYINSPDEETVKAFIEEIRLRVTSRLKEDYSRFDPDLDFQDQLENLKYLRRIEVLKQEEYEFIREELRSSHLIK